MRQRWHLWFVGLIVIATAYGGFTLMTARALQTNNFIFDDWQVHNRTLQTLEINEQQAKMVYEDAINAGEKAGSRWSDMVARMSQMGIEINANMKLSTVLSRDIQPALAELNYEITLLQNEATRNSLTITLRNKIYEVGEAIAALQSQYTELSMAQDAMTQGVSLYNQGKLAEDAYLDLQYQVDQAEVNVRVAERELSDKQVALNSFVGISPDNIYDLDQVEAINQIPLDSVDSYIEQALEERFEMKHLVGQIALKEEELAAYKRIFDEVKMDDDIKTRYQAVKDDLKRLDIQKQLTTQDIEKEIRSLYLDLKIAEERIAVLWDQVRAATDTMNQTSINYEKGIVQKSQMTKAESQLTSAKVNYQASIYQYNTLRMQLDFAIAAGCGGAK